MSFADEAVIEVRAGDGGRGCIAFRREKFVPRGGPSGGDGGDGGNVWIVADASVHTLSNFQYQRLFRARRGAHGQGSDKTGERGADVMVRVPIGTLVVDVGSDEPLADLVQTDQRCLAARGGRGGRGNARFATATRQAPRFAEPGEPGEQRRLRLTLKLLADVGLVGLPNAGKSSLLARISAARPKIADYPFTTLTPHLGVVRLDDVRSFVAADVPGLIEGAHQGHGLGDRFLRHVERTALLVHVVDASDGAGDVMRDYGIVRDELRQAGLGLTDKPCVIALNKLDAVADRRRLARLQARFRAHGVSCHLVSAVTGEGVRGLLEELASGVAQRRAERAVEVAE